MAPQELLNMLFMIVGGLLGIFMKVLWAAHKALYEADKALAHKLNAVEILVAGDYVRREDFDRKIDALFNKVDKVLDALHNKVDRRHDQ